MQSLRAVQQALLEDTDGILRGHWRTRNVIYSFCDKRVDEDDEMMKDRLIRECVCKKMRTVQYIEETAHESGNASYTTTFTVLLKCFEETSEQQPLFNFAPVAERCLIESCGDHTVRDIRGVEYDVRAKEVENSRYNEDDVLVTLVVQVSSSAEQPIGSSNSASIIHECINAGSAWIFKQGLPGSPLIVPPVVDWGMQHTIREVECSEYSAHVDILPVKPSHGIHDGHVSGHCTYTVHKSPMDSWAYHTRGADSSDDSIEENRIDTALRVTVTVRAGARVPASIDVCGNTVHVVDEELASDDGDKKYMCCDLMEIVKAYYQQVVCADDADDVEGCMQAIVDITLCTLAHSINSDNKSLLEEEEFKLI